MRLTNKRQLNDGTAPIEERLVTIEDEKSAFYTVRNFLKVTDPVYKRISTALAEISAHLGGGKTVIQSQ